MDCSWGALENYKRLGEEFNNKTNVLKAKYLPIELDLSIPLGDCKKFGFN